MRPGSAAFALQAGLSLPIRRRRSSRLRRGPAVNSFKHHAYVILAANFALTMFIRKSDVNFVPSLPCAGSERGNRRYELNSSSKLDEAVADHRAFLGPYD